MANVVRMNVTVLWAIHTPTAFVLSPAVLSTLPKLRMLGIMFDDQMRIADLGVAFTGSDREYRKVCPLLVALCAYNCNAPEKSLDHIHRIVRFRARRTHNSLQRLAIACPESFHAQPLATLGEYVDDRSWCHYPRRSGWMILIVRITVFGRPGTNPSSTILNTSHSGGAIIMQISMPTHAPIYNATEGLTVNLIKCNRNQILTTSYNR
ncbi:hypothetical protein C8Q74DRAFT_1046107 [Fomes fomentarius]|nr:hypothetical protein C8Q74DRAFT_1046107 [Fomes fomentarius]